MKLSSQSILIAAIATASATAAFATDRLFVDANTVRKVQQILTDPVDGQMGPQTRAALTNFPRSENLERSRGTLGG